MPRCHGVTHGLRVGTSGWHYAHWREVFYHAGEAPSPPWVTGPLAHVRMDGREGWYRGEYGANGLHWLAQWLENVLQEAGRACVFFNNDADGGAVRDAMALKAPMADAQWRGRRLRAPPRQRPLGG